MTTNPPTAPRLRRRSSTSFSTNDIPGLAQWLEAKGYQRLPSRSVLEYARLSRRQSLVVCYNGSTVLCQGADAQPAIDLLNTLIVEDEAQRGLPL